MSQETRAAAHRAGSDWKALYESIDSYAEGVMSAQHEAQKQVRSAYLGYLEQIKTSLQQPSVHEAVRAYGELVKGGMTRPAEVQAMVEDARHYTKAVQDVQSSIGAKVQEASAALNDEVQKASARVTAAQRVELEKLVKNLQSGFSKIDAKHVDAVTLAVTGQAVILAALLQAQSI